MPGPRVLTGPGAEGGGLEEGLWYTADWDFWLKLAAAGKTLPSPPSLGVPYPSPSPDDPGQCRHPRLPKAARDRPVPAPRHLSIDEKEAEESAQRVARFSIDVNTYLASFIRGRELGAMLAPSEVPQPGSCWLASLPSRFANCGANIATLSMAWQSPNSSPGGRPRDPVHLVHCLPSRRCKPGLGLRQTAIRISGRILSSLQARGR